ncbi:MAG: outer membrane protein assembly factor BamA [Saprospiraceae bacterium]
MKKTKLCTLLCILLMAKLWAQSPLDSSLNTSTEWLEIGGISVAGATNTNPQTIVMMSGLKIGQRIQIPGPSIQKAIRTLWQQQLFSDIQVVETDRKGDILFLQIRLIEMPRLAAFQLLGIPQKWETPLRKKLTNLLVIAEKVTPDTKKKAQNAVQEWLQEKGYFFAKVSIAEKVGEAPAQVSLAIHIQPGNKTKVKTIQFIGNEVVNDTKLRKILETKSKQVPFGKKSFLPAVFLHDQQKIIQYYQQLGYLDAKINQAIVDTLSDKSLQLTLQLSEGRPYFFGNISWKGNAVYTEKTLQKILGIQKGDVYNPILLEQRLRFDPKDKDISSLYLDHGYLFFQVEPVVTHMENQQIDLEIQITEGPLATIGSVEISGNEKTHEHVIRRELRTQPGHSFSRADILRSQQTLINLGYFNPETLDLKTTVNPENGTVDLQYIVEEKPSSKYELAASWNPGSSDQGGGLVGTVGLTLTNFSLRKLFQGNKGTFTPMGDGQTLSLRAQSTGRDYQAYNFSFTEPWLGGKRPNSLTLAGFHQRFTNTSSVTAENPFASLSVTGASLQLGSRLPWLKGNVVATTELSFQHIYLNGLDEVLLEDGSTISKGHFNNFYLKQSLTYYTLSDPFFPTKGAKITLSGQWTPPYSLLGNGLCSNWMEYQKYRLGTAWYTSLNKKWVVKLNGQMGWLSAYDQTVGLPPFERFELGGNGINSQQLAFAGNDLIALRGYPDNYLEGTLNGGGASFAKFSVELRYPLINTPSTRAFLLAFGEGGNIWKSSRQFNPFDLKPTVGLGIRMQVPFLGTIGLDYGLGLDKPELAGQKWTKYGTFNFILGFEPE